LGACFLVCLRLVTASIFSLPLTHRHRQRQRQRQRDRDRDRDRDGETDRTGDGGSKILKGDRQRERDKRHTERETKKERGTQALLTKPSKDPPNWWFSFPVPVCFVTCLLGVGMGGRVYHVDGKTG